MAKQPSEPSRPPEPHREPFRQPTVPPELPASPAGAAQEEGKPPPHGTARSADQALAVPRVIDPLERVSAGSGLHRFKVRSDNYTPQTVHYVLARSEAEARDHYLEVTTIKAQIDALKADGATSVETPRLAVTRLLD